MHTKIYIPQHTTPHQPNMHTNMHMAQTWSERVFKWSTISFQDLFFKFLHMCISGYPPASAVARCQNRSVFFKSFHCWLWLAPTFQEETPRLLWLSAQYWRFDAQAPSESRRSASVWDVLEWTGKGARRGSGPARCQGKPKKEMLGRSWGDKDPRELWTMACGS